MARLARKPLSLFALLFAAANASPGFAQYAGNIVDTDDNALFDTVHINLPGEEDDAASTETRLDRQNQIVDEALQAMDQAIPQKRVPSRAIYASRNSGVAVSERRRRELEPVGIAAGAFRLYPELSVDFFFDSNIYKQDNDAISDFGVIPGTRLLAVAESRRNFISIDLSAMQRLYAQESSENSLAYNASVDERYEISRGAMLLAGLSHDHDVLERGSSGEVVTTKEPIEFYSSQAYLGGTLDRGLFNAKLRTDIRNYNYLDARNLFGATVDEDFRDLTSVSVLARLGYRLSGPTEAFASVRHEWRDFRVDSLLFDRDVRELELLVGLKGELSPLLRASLGVGLLSDNFEDPQLDDFTALAIDTSLEWLASELTTVKLAGRRRVSTSADITASAFLETALNADVEHELLRNLILNGYLGYRHQDYRQSIREVDRWRTGIGADWYLGNRFIVTLDLEYANQVNRGVVDRNYDALKGQLGVKSRF